MNAQAWDDPAEELRSIASELEQAEKDSSTAADLLGRQDVLEAEAAVGIKLIWSQLFARPHSEMHSDWSLKLSDDAFFDSLAPWPSVQPFLCELLGCPTDHGLYQLRCESRRAAVAKGRWVAKMLCAIADWLDDQDRLTFNMTDDRRVRGDAQKADEHTVSRATEMIRISVTEATLRPAVEVNRETNGDQDDLEIGRIVYENRCQKHPLSMRVLKNQHGWSGDDKGFVAKGKAYASIRGVAFPKLRRGRKLGVKGGKWGGQK